MTYRRREVRKSKCTLDGVLSILGVESLRRPDSGGERRTGYVGVNIPLHDPDECFEYFQ